MRVSLAAVSIGPPRGTPSDQASTTIPLPRTRSNTSSHVEVDPLLFCSSTTNTLSDRADIRPATRIQLGTRSSAHVRGPLAKLARRGTRFLVNGWSKPWLMAGSLQKDCRFCMSVQAFKLFRLFGRFLLKEPLAS